MNKKLRIFLVYFLAGVIGTISVLLIRYFVMESIDIGGFLQGIIVIAISVTLLSPIYVRMDPSSDSFKTWSTAAGIGTMMAVYLQYKLGEELVQDAGKIGGISLLILYGVAIMSVAYTWMKFISPSSNSREE